MGQKPIEGSNPSLSAIPSRLGSASRFPCPHSFHGWRREIFQYMNKSPYRKLLICRPGFEAALLEELADRNVRTVERVPWSPGLIGIVLQQEAPVTFCIFERQRMSVAGFIPVEALKPIAEATVREVFVKLMARDSSSWTLHAYAVEEG